MSLRSVTLHPRTPSRPRLRGLLPALALGLVGPLALAGCSGEDTAPGADEVQYVAIGDSFSSGIGLAPTSDEDCGQSSANYPHLFTEAHDGIDLDDVTCGGAEPASLTTPQVLVDGSRPPSVEAVKPETDLVTYSLGANQDLSFGTLIYMCSPLQATDPTGSPCKDAQGADLPQRLAKTLSDRTAAAILAIRDRAPEARVVVVGYPMVFTRAGSCDGMPMPRGDLDWAVRINESWNEGLERGATLAGAEFLDVAEVTRGHEACSDDPWINPTAFPLEAPDPTPTGSPTTPTDEPTEDDDEESDGSPAHPTSRLHEVVAQALGRLWATAP